MDVKAPDTLEKIQQAALEEFSQKGFLGASLRQIVKNAGVTTGAFYGSQHGGAGGGVYHSLYGSVAALGTGDPGAGSLTVPHHSQRNVQWSFRNRGT